MCGGGGGGDDDDGDASRIRKGYNCWDVAAGVLFKKAAILAGDF